MSIKRSGGRVVMPSHMIGAVVMGLRASVDWAEKMVVDTRFELVTPAMSMQCSTTELIDHPFQKDGSSTFGGV